MLNVIAGNNWIVYTVSMKENTADIVFPESGEHISDARGYFTGLIRNHVEEDYQSPLLELLDTEALTEIYRTKNDYELEFHTNRSAGDIWMRCETELAERDEQGRADRIDVILKNIDRIKKRVLAEARDRENLELMTNRAFESSKILKFSWNVEESSGIASRGLMERGIPQRMEPMPDAFRKLAVRPDYHESFDELCRHSLRGESPVSLDFVAANGNWKNLTLEILERTEAGSPRIILGILENINELHHMQEENRTMTEVCRFAIENHYEEADLINLAENTVTEVLQTMGGNDVGFHKAEGTGYREEIRKLIDERAYGDSDRKALETLLPEHLPAVLEREGKHVVRLRLINDEGVPSWKQLNCMFFREDHNQVILMGTNVQEEEDVKEQLRNAALEAQEANRAKSAFLANMSHEIRTPMNAIVGISEILLSKDLPADVIDDITTIQNAGSSLLGIINDILDFSKIETGKLELNEAEYMMTSLLMDISNVISVRLSGQPVRFMMDLDPSLPNRYLGDDIRLKQILINLIGNAVKFTREGYIQLRIEGEEVADHKYRLQFEIKDTGIGIRQEDMGKLFKNFSQVDTKRNRSISGSGLGLSISRDLAQLMGGDLTVSSTYGKGSTFTVTILQENLDYEKIGEVQNKNVRILIYEQNETIIYSLCRTLRNLGLEYDVCREPERIRQFEGMTHVLIRRKNFLLLREKLEFMFRSSNIYLIMENDEHASSKLMQYKQLQLPLISMQLINALNGEAIVTSIKAKAFDRSQIVPLPFARVLIVDDNNTNLQVAQGLMAPYRMKIDIATSGFRAIEMVKSINYNAIFMDHMMPEMDGIEATRYIRNLAGSYYKTVPIIALTANAMNDAREMFEQAGMNDFVAKPIEMTELNRVLKRFVQPQAPDDFVPQPISDQKTARAPSSGAADFTAPAAPPAIAAPAAAAIPSDSGSMLQQLLAQNNALLSQNMLLLQNLVGGAPETAYTAPDKDSGTEPAEYEDNAFPEAPDEPEVLEDLHGPIAGIDMHRTLETYGGSVPIYHNILRTYYHDLRTREPQLEDYLAREDLENFTISVHAIKSASYGAGATELGQLAQQLESAGRQEDLAKVKALYPKFLDTMRFIETNVGRYVDLYLETDKDASGEALDAFDPGDVKRLIQSCEDMDYMRAEDILREMNEKTYPDELELLLIRMIGYCEAFEYDQLEDAIRSLPQ